MSASVHSPLPRARFAVAGATGRVGATLANLLAADGVDVVALTRRPDEIRASAGVALLLLSTSIGRRRFKMPCGASTGSSFRTARRPDRWRTRSP
jgi:nucleoside-diphosphate-sugar epimerase